MKTIKLTTRNNEFICSDRCKDNNVLKTVARAVHEDINLHHIYLQLANLNGIKLLNAWMHNANLRSSVLIGSDVRGSNLAEADISYADLAGANFQRVNLTNTDLTGTNLRGTDLRGARLVGAKYTKRQIDSAITDETTIFQE